MNPAIDMAGMVFGHLSVVRRVAARGASKQAFWLCHCSCGSEVIKAGFSIRNGSGSCGCQRRVSTAHGHTRGGKSSATYQTWRAMVARCNDVRDKQFPSYGARGITVCARWMTFENFLADMGERPTGTTLDRKNNSGNYEAGNCAWATPTEQARNRRNNRLTTAAVADIRARKARGERQADIARSFGVDPSLVSRIVRNESWR